MANDRAVAPRPSRSADDLEKDPLETRNIAAPGFKKNKEQRKALRKLQNKLASVEATRLQPL